MSCGTCCPPFVIRKAYTIEGSSTPRRKSSAIRRLYCSTRCARRSNFPRICVRSLDASRSRGPLGAGPCFLTPFCSCSAASSAPSRGKSDRVQAEHDARPAFLALDFLARFRSTVPYVRHQLHRRALHHVALAVRLQHRNVFGCQHPRRRQTAQEGHPHMHVRGTELLLGVCALCFGLALDCASAIAWATLSEPGTRYVLNTVAVSSLSSAALTRDRVACTSHQALVSHFCHRLSHCSTALPLRSLLRLALARRRHLEVRHF